MSPLEAEFRGLEHETQDLDHITQRMSIDSMGKTLAKRFEKYYIPEPNSGCWLWIGACDASGYGRFWRRKGNSLAHRMSYEVFVGVIPNNSVIDHKCHNKCCVNPHHLEVVAQKENCRRYQRHIKQNPHLYRHAAGGKPGRYVRNAHGKLNGVLGFGV